MHKLKRQMGFTLPEIAITLAISGILTAMAVPSFTGMLERRKLVSAAEAIESDLRWARGEAIKQNTAVTVAFTPGAPPATWGYTINPGSKTVNSASVAEYKGIGLATNFGGNNTTFDPVRGTANSGTVTVTSATGKQLRIILSILGRTHICSVGGTIGDHDPC